MLTAWGIIMADMTSQVFYRKWRPKTLADVVGQDHVTQTLRNAVRSGHVAHAYLFCGPRGTGKTSIGRILAKTVNCMSPKDGEPCNTCDMCRSFNEGSAIDIIEIDAASNRGIDDMRELTDKVHYAPNAARYKVYIIDEVHMITKEGSNAFLKTLEEPPPHVIFILATTDPQKILSTILSRCQRFDFRRLSNSAVIGKLDEICKSENIVIPNEALRLVARVSTGSLRDAENLLEQLLAYYGNNIELPQVQAMLGMTGDLRVKELAGYVLSKNLSAGIKTINSISNDGLDLRQINKEIVNYLRDLLLIKTADEELVDVTRDELAEMKTAIANVSIDYLVRAIKLFGTGDLRLDTYSSLPMELIFVECTLSTDHKAVPISSEQADIGARVTEEKPQYSPEHSRRAEPVKQERMTSSITIDPAAAKQGKSAFSDPPAETLPAAGANPAGTAPVLQKKDAGSLQDLDYFIAHWKEFIDSMRGEGSRRNLDAFLRSACEPIGVEGDVLVLGFYYDFHKNYIEDQKYKHLVEKKLREIFGHPYKVRCVLREKGKRSPEQFTDDEPENPLVQAALEMGLKNPRVIEEKP